MPEPEVRNESSGDAHIVIQARDIHGDINLVTGAPVRTRYREQVRRIAPPELLDRSAELAELSSFCLSADAPSYSWWRAPAWSGKSALMSTFALNAPPGVRVVSFFVTARWSSQNDRAAFIDNVTEQLLALLGETLPPLLTESTRETHLLGLLEDAAAACQSRGERLVLLVDGLDEDRGVHTGPDSHSIAALLPASPPAGLRVVVAGRPNPPIPADVPPNHPLHDPAIVRPLAPSAAAQAIRVEMERELKNLLHGSAAQQDLLGLVAVAGGGLSAADLTSLTGLSPYEVADSLRTVVGRSFSARDGHFQPGRVYVLGHEELQATALELLGADRLSSYRERVHTWAEGYRERGWPGETPDYLLRGYYSLLEESGDIARMVSFATDPARHARLLTVSGGDATAVAEITTVIDLLASGDEPDLVTLARLAVHRDRLTDRNHGIPAVLPAVWAVLGHVDRAEAVANSIQHPGNRIAALATVATAVADAGDHARADALLGQALEISLSGDQAGWALAELVDALADRGDVAGAEAVARVVTGSQYQVRAWTRLAALAGDRAADLLYDARRAASTLADPVAQARALAYVATTAAHVGELGWATMVARTIAIDYERARAMLAVATTAAESGEVDEADVIVGGITRSVLRESMLTPLLIRLVAATARGGGLARATTVVRKFLHSSEQIPALASAVAATGDLDRAEGIARSSIDSTEQDRALGALASTVAATGQLGQAERIACAITDPEHQRRTMTTAIALAGGISLHQTDALLDNVLGPRSQTEAWTTLARTVASLGQPAHATDFLDRADAAAQAVDPEHRAAALASVAHAAASSGDPARATLLLDRIADIVHEDTRSSDHSWALEGAAAKAAADAGDLDKAVVLASGVDEPRARARALKALAGLAAQTGDLEWALHIASRIGPAVARKRPRNLLHLFHHGLAVVDRYLSEQAQALHAVVSVAASAGNLDDATTIARSAVDVDDRDWLLVSLTEIAALRGDVNRAEVAVREIHGTVQAAWALALAAEAATFHGEPGRAAVLFRRAETGLRASRDSEERLWGSMRMAESAAQCGDAERGWTFADSIIPITALTGPVFTVLEEPAFGSRGADRYPQARAIAAFAKFSADYLFDAEDTAEAVVDPCERAFALTWTGRAAAEIGDHDRADRLLDLAEITAHAITDAEEQALALCAVAQETEADRAEQVLQAIADPGRRAQALLEFAADPARRRPATIAKALQSGHWTQAAELLTEVEPEALAALTEELEKIRAAGSRTA